MPVLDPPENITPVVAGPVSRAMIELRNRRDTIDFLQRRFAFTHDLQSQVAKKLGSGCARQIPNLSSWCPCRDGLSDLIGQHHDFTDGTPPPIPSSAALAATSAFPEAHFTGLILRNPGKMQYLKFRRVFDGTAFANQSDKALRHDSIERGNETVDVHAHMYESANDIHDVVRVYRGEDKVSGKG
jgi:hypothetical protein